MPVLTRRCVIVLSGGSLVGLASGEAHAAPAVQRQDVSMDESDFSWKATFTLYNQLVAKVSGGLALTERERTAYFALDFRARLELGAYDGILRNPEPYVEALFRIGLAAHARTLTQAVQLGPIRRDQSDAAKEVSRDNLRAMAHDHLDGDDTIYDKAVFAFWLQSEGIA